MKEVLMIHDVTEDILKLPLKDYVLTFDDGLYSQYYYLPVLKDIPTRKILFPSGKYVSDGGMARRQCVNTFYNKDEWSPVTYFPDCVEARTKFDQTDGVICYQYMNISEIREMSKNGFEIGGHGFAHRRVYPESLQGQVKEMTEDVNKMFEWLSKNIGITPVSYCFPFNIEPRFMREILKRYGIQEFFGGERTPVENLL